jgi:hypothetical protein
MKGMEMAESIGKVAIRELSRQSLPEALLQAIATRPDGEQASGRPRELLMRLLGTKEAQDALFDQSDTGKQRLSELIASSVFDTDVSEYSDRLAQLLVSELFGVLNWAQHLRRSDTS